MLIIMQGWPGSGKSTKAKEILQDDLALGNRIARVSRDDLRKQLFDGEGVLKGWQEQAVSEAEKAAAGSLLRSGVSVIVDSTNLTDWRVSELRNIAREMGHAAALCPVKTDIATCIVQDRQRTRQVGAEVIEMFARKHPVEKWPT